MGMVGGGGNVGGVGGEECHYSILSTSVFV